MKYVSLRTTDKTVVAPNDRRQNYGRENRAAAQKLRVVARREQRINASRAKSARQTMREES